MHSGAFKRSISKCGSWLDAKARYLLSLKSNLINAHRDALKANHLSVNSVAKKKKANKLFLPSGDNLLNFSQALHHLITKKWTFELNTVKDIFPVKVKKIYENSLHLIPSPAPSVKIQNMGGKVCLRCKGKTLPQVNFPANGLNFHCEGD